jgi:hypothetical protein
MPAQNTAASSQSVRRVSSSATRAVSANKDRSAGKKT